MTFQDSVSVLIALICAAWVLKKWLRPFFTPLACRAAGARPPDLLQIDPPEGR